MENNGPASMEGIEIEDHAPHLDPSEILKSAKAEPRRTFAGIDAAELSTYIDAETDWLVDYIFAADQPTVFGAASKATKTTQLVDLAVALATATPWLNNFKVSKRRKVLFITGESNYRAVSKRFLRALSAHGMDWGGQQPMP